LIDRPDVRDLMDIKHYGLLDIMSDISEEPAAFIFKLTKHPRRPEP